MKKLAIVPQVSGLGGMASFRLKFESGLRACGVQVTDNPDEEDVQAVLVIGGTRDARPLWRARRRGLPVVQRLDGMNWIHRRRNTGWRHFLRAESGNLLLAFIRRQLATGIVYQSAFSRDWWQREHGHLPIPSCVIHNGVDLQAYSPDGAHQRPVDRFRVLLVEGNFGGGYEQGLETAVALVRRLNAIGLSKAVELMVLGNISSQLQADWQARMDFPVVWGGVAPRERIPEFDRSAHLLYSADLNAACPNAVIEALACGLPVAAFDTGALPELVPPSAGCVVAYGGDPWKLEPPDVDGLAKASTQILLENASFRQAARNHAEGHFSLEHMVGEYLAFLGSLAERTLSWKGRM